MKLAIFKDQKSIGKSPGFAGVVRNVECGDTRFFSNGCEHIKHFRSI